MGQVLSVMKGLARGGLTRIVVTHALGFASEVADAVAYMDAGTIVEAGPPGRCLAHRRRSAPRPSSPR